MDSTQNTQPAANELEAAVESAPEELDFITSEDLAPREKVETVRIQLPGGKKGKLLVRRLTGKQAIKLLEDAGKTKAAGDVVVMKLVRCLAHPADNAQPFLSDAGALQLFERNEAAFVDVFLRAIHSVNPLIKNA